MKAPHRKAVAVARVRPTTTALTLAAVLYLAILVTLAAIGVIHL